MYLIGQSRVSRPFTATNRIMIEIEETTRSYFSEDYYLSLDRVIFIGIRTYRTMELPGT